MDAEKPMWYITHKYENDTDDEPIRIELHLMNTLIAVALRLGKAHGVKHKRIRGVAYELQTVKYEGIINPHVKNADYAERALIEYLMSFSMDVFFKAKALHTELSKRPKKRKKKANVD